MKRRCDYMRKRTYLESDDHEQNVFRRKVVINEHSSPENISLQSLSSDLSKIFDKYPFMIEDVSDFWSFVNKYELLEKKKGITECPNDGKGADYDNKDFPKEHNPGHCVNILLNVPVKEIIDVIAHKVRNASNEYADKFKFLVSLYIDFKQKEKFTILKKIRDTQKELPITLYREEILNTISNERVIVIAGDTGCGKSTQIPQYLMQAGYNRVACTQPRRIACVSLSNRVAREMLSEHTSEVGFQIRFEKNLNSNTKILFVTEGLLLRQISDNKLLSEYDVIILDEVHERHLHGDFLLGIMKCLLYQRNDFKLILMSATINIQLFEDYFGSYAKVIQVPGRLFPIKTQYHPISKVDKIGSKNDFDSAPYIQILNLIDHKYPKDERGDVLIFLSGVKEITTVVEAAKLYNEKTQSWCILPLYSSLSLEEQNKVFDYPPEGYRKCVVSTNVAETSITIDGIRFVVDSGKVNEISYDPICRLQRLKEFWISRASAEQRKGRAGRTGPGVCFRLYSEEEFAAMSQYTLPEIQRVPLDSILLQMIALGLPDARKFPFIEPPSSSSIENSICNLKLYNALHNDEKLTEMGKMLAKLPVDIPLGKMLIMGTLFHQVESVLSLAAALSVQSPFTHKAYRDLEMQDLRKEMESDHGDPITLLNIFREWLKLKNKSGDNVGHYPSSKRWCKKRGLEEQRFYEMIKLRSQFKDLLVLECKLVNEDLTVVKSEAEMTRHERIMRHGELSQLRKMKKTLAQQNSGNKRKILKTDDTWEIEPSEFEEDSATDIKDVDFRLKNNPSQVQRLLANSAANSYKDLSMLKVILCSSIYPQVAISDEFNSSRTVKEQLFHTVGKSYIALHPNSYFSFNPEITQLNNDDIIDCPPGFESKLPISSKHQVLFYMSLLETTKTYLVNTLRMPAAQSLILFCNSLHTNRDFTRIICDQWIELTFTSSSAAEILILKATKIRSLWSKLLVLQLQGKDRNNLNEVVTSDVVKFLSCEIYYTIKRLLNADIKTLFAPPSEDTLNLDDVECCNPFESHFKIRPNEEIGGLQVTDYLTYNCLSTDDVLLSEMWECDECSLIAPFTPLEKLQHKHRHKTSNEGLVDCVVGEEAQRSSSLPPRKSNTRSYHCDVCNKDFYFTPTEILRHRVEHQSIV